MEQFVVWFCSSLIVFTIWGLWKTRIGTKWEPIYKDYQREWDIGDGKHGSLTVAEHSGVWIRSAAKEQSAKAAFEEGIRQDIKQSWEQLPEEINIYVTDLEDLEQPRKVYTTGDVARKLHEDLCQEDCTGVWATPRGWECACGEITRISEPFSMSSEVQLDG